jgi:thiol-disulfide isomerase/thioredoxin
MRKILLIFLIGLLLQNALAQDAVKPTDSADGKPIVYFFWGEGCPVCKDIKNVLTRLEGEYEGLLVKDFEVYNNRDNLGLLQDMMDAYGRKSNSVPVTFVGENMIDGYFPGFTDERLERFVVECLTEGCITPEEKLSAYRNPTTTTIQTTTSTTLTKQQTNESGQDAEVVVYFFWGEGCPHCHTQKPFMESLEDKYPNLVVKSFETWNNRDNAKLFQEMASAYGARASGVPMTFIGDFEPIVGYGGQSSTGKRIEEEILYCIEHGCGNPMDKLGGSDKSPDDKVICVHAFIRAGCPQCDQIRPHLSALEEKYNLAITIHDVSQSQEAEIYDSFKQLYGLEYAAYPVVFVGDYYFIGESAVLRDLESAILSCKTGGCACPAEKIRGMTSSLPGRGDSTHEAVDTLNVPLIGAVEISSMPIWVVTVIIAFLDGFNPCSLWVLTFLLAIVIHTKSRWKIFLVGGTYLLVTSAAYGVFIAGMLNVFLYVAYLWWIRLGVGLIAFFFAIVNIKDYFWYKKGLSFTISDDHKPGIFQKVRNIRKLMGEGSSLTLIWATAAMALGITLVELPCTAGLPVIWTNIVAQQNIGSAMFLGLLGVYLLVYLSIEIIIFLTALFTLKSGKMEEKHGRSLKLLGGVIMLTLALVMVFAPKLMEDVASSLMVFAAAIGFTLIVLYVHRKVLPKHGIIIGSEELAGETESEVK